MTLLLTAAASLLLLGSYLVVRAVIQADRLEVRHQPLPKSQTSDVAIHRRAA